MSINLLENCAPCYAFSISELPPSSPGITIKGGLAANSPFYLKVTDKFGNACVSAQATSDGSGNITFAIPASWPAGWFNRNNGTFLLEISVQTTPWTAVEMLLSGNTYTCIEVECLSDEVNNYTIE